MAVEVSALDEDHPVVDLSKPMHSQSPSENARPQSPTENKIVLSAAQLFALGAKKKTFLSPRSPTSPPTSANNTITLSLPPQKHQNQRLTISNSSSNQEQQQPPAEDPAAASSSDNPFDFEFKNPFSSKRFHLSNYRKSIDRNSILLSPPVTSATSGSAPMTEEEAENARLLQLKTFFSKFFKGKKDGKKGKGADQVALTEDYQLWNNLTPLLVQPSAVFMGLSFMIDDKGGALTDKANVDWNMNIILALVKVVILPYTYTAKDTKIKNRDGKRSSIDKGKESRVSQLSAKDKEEKEAKEHKRFMIIKVQYGDYLPSWLIERSLEDFVRLYESYHTPIPEAALLSKTLSIPKPPAAIRSRFGLTGKSAKAGDLDSQDIGDQENSPIDNANAFDSKAAPKLAMELQTFLQEMIRYAMHMPDAERMCKFLELSALTLTNVPDGGYQGKEGYLNVIKQKRLMDEGPLTNAIKKVYRKPVSKYFIVRDSFIIVAASHKNTEILDVILLDSSFKVTKSPRHLHAPHTFDIINAELKFHVRAKSDHRRRQFVESIRKMPSLWKETKRFHSFAPVRTDVSAQWLVDGRDYFWNASKALEMAKESIYILDWMLSPEILLRRHQRDGVDWSLKDILGRKANEGVKIYIVLYSEVDAAMHLASLRAKKLLRKLCPENIWVQRHGPNLKTAWWAHHEKLIVVDNMIAFIGGLDLCFGRWDTGEHTLIDSKEDQNGPRWPGQDYSNPRIKDFCDLSKPDVDAIDRAENPRMPWHDVGLQILGQPSRDVARHFIQRWNFLCRTKPKQKRIPFLLPKPDIHLSKLEEMGLKGTCEVQILRSVSSWSIGVKDPECSILTAYLAAIERAEHFIYIENQFFITSTNVNKTIVHNGIGRALTDRIIKANKAGDKFRVIVVLPLVPGFEGGINTPEATSVRMVMLSIYETICHGKNSIYGRLATAGVTKPHKYISFYGLRNWAKFGEQFITEQVYIHAKMMIVDDRVAIIGSANINERSMLGNRDSEIAAVVRDKDYIDSTMNGAPYKVSRFAHTLRMNLMTEHLGLCPGHDHNGNLSSNSGNTPFSPLDFVDPVHPAFFEEIWKHYANSNTLIFRDMFKCIPDNTVKTWSDYTKFNDQSNIDDPRMKEERTLKDRAMNKILGPTLSEHFTSAGHDSGEEDEDEDTQHRPLRKNREANRAAKKALRDDDSGDDEDPIRDKARDERIIRQDPSAESELKLRQNRKKPSEKNLRTDERVTAHEKTREQTEELNQERRQGGIVSADPEKDSSVRRTVAQQMDGSNDGAGVGGEKHGKLVKGLSVESRLNVKRTASALAGDNDVRMAMENDLSKVQGHLVEWPLDFLRDEIQSHNFCYPKDYNHPIDLYT
ncbi:Phospholipase D1 [Linnemannia hyalina]|uniref:Phospholipase n=1 Tax=Linnemannia hyalina TaxID=64524 RepID=A0A9P7XRI5_9FUNG|nr:Phospholipase D1 [Linnemannia hyalina]